MDREAWSQKGSVEVVKWFLLTTQTATDPSKRRLWHFRFCLATVGKPFILFILRDLMVLATTKRKMLAFALFSIINNSLQNLITISTCTFVHTFLFLYFLLKCLHSIMIGEHDSRKTRSFTVVSFSIHPINCCGVKVRRHICTP